MLAEIPSFDEFQSVELEVLFGALDTLTSPYVQKNVGKLTLERDLSVCLERIEEMLDASPDQDTATYAIGPDEVEKEKQLETVMFRYNHEGWLAYMNEVGTVMNEAAGLPVNF